MCIFMQIYMYMLLSVVSVSLSQKSSVEVHSVKRH